MRVIDFILSLLSDCNTSLADTDLNVLCSNNSPPRYKYLYPLLYQELKKEGLSDIPDVLKGCYYSTLSYITYLECEYKNLQYLLKENHFDYVTYKGFDFAGRFYDVPGTRPMTDIDVLVRKRDYEKLGNILAGNGFEYKVSETHSHLFRKNDVCYEFHTDLFPYQNLIFFGLDKISCDEILNQGLMDNETCLLVSMFQFYSIQGKSRRLIPLVDMFQIISKGINKQRWDDLVINCNADFLILFSHYYMLEFYGYSPITDNLLECCKDKNKYRKRFIKLVHTAKYNSDTYPLVFVMTRSRLKKIWRIIFPSKEIYKYYTMGKRFPFIVHFKRVLEQVWQVVRKPSSPFKKQPNSKSYSD